MAWRMRKSIKLGPLRLNLSKSGVGYSVGGKHFRFGKTATGKSYSSASIPGTGLSNRTYMSSSKRGQVGINYRKHRTPFFLFLGFIGLLILIFGNNYRWGIACIVVAIGIGFFTYRKNRKQQSADQEHNVYLNKLLATERVEPEILGHIKVINDSIRIVCETKNIDTLKSRINDIINHSNAVQDIYDSDYYLKTKHEIKSRTELLELANENIARIAGNEFKLAIAKLSSYSSPKIAANALMKTQLKLIDLRESLYPEALNADKYISVINGCHDELDNKKKELLT